MAKKEVQKAGKGQQGQSMQNEPKVKPMQLSPIVQPIAFVPYSTQNEELYMYDDQDAYGGYADGYFEEDLPREVAKKFNWVSLILIILSLAAIAVMVVGKFVKDQRFLIMVFDKSGLDAVIDAFKDLSDIELIHAVPFGIAGMALGALLIIVGALIKIMRPGSSIVAKIGAVLGALAGVVVLVVSLIEKATVSTDYGLYIVVGIMLLCALIALSVKGSKKR